MTLVDRQVAYLWAVWTNPTGSTLVTDCATAHNFAKWFNDQNWDDGSKLRGVYSTEEAAESMRRVVWKEMNG